MDVISCVGLTKRFGPTIAVNGLDLAVSSGQVYGFLGPNGAGKTTTIRMLLGLIAPSAGQVYLLGRRLPDPRVVAPAGSMIEEPAFYPWMTGRVNLEVLGAIDAQAAARLLARWPVRHADGQLLVEHDSGRDVNGVLVAGGVVAESVTVERPGLEDRFLEITGKEDARAVAAGS